MSPALFKAIEAVLTIFFVVTLFYWFPYFFECSKIGGTIQQTEETNGSMAEAADSFRRRLRGGLSEEGKLYGVADSAHMSLNLIRFHCEEGEYSELATLFMNPAEGAIIQVYSRGTHGIFSIGTMAIFGLVYFTVTCCVYGISVPAGLFIPSMMSGAAIGRMFGEFVSQIAGEENTDPGLFALCGAAAMLGGVTRMTISLCAIMLELTNDITLALPMILALAASKVAGDMLSHPIYEVHVELMGAPYLVRQKCYNFFLDIFYFAVAVHHIFFYRSGLLQYLKMLVHLYHAFAWPCGTSSRLSTHDEDGCLQDHEPPASFDALTAMSVMSPNVKTLLITTSLQEMMEMLHTTHHAFPVVRTREGGQIVGIISRQNLLNLYVVFIKKHKAGAHGECCPAPTASSAYCWLWVALGALVLTNFRCAETGWQDAYNIDLSRSLEPAPYKVDQQLSLRRTYRLFVTMGLRHLIVSLPQLPHRVCVCAPLCQQLTQSRCRRQVIDSGGAVAGMITRKNFLNMAVERSP